MLFYRVRDGPGGGFGVGHGASGAENGSKSRFSRYPPKPPRTPQNVIITCFWRVLVGFGGRWVVLVGSKTGQKRSKTNFSEMTPFGPEMTPHTPKHYFPAVLGVFGACGAGVLKIAFLVQNRPGRVLVSHMGGQKSSVFRVKIREQHQQHAN